MKSKLLIWFLAFKLEKESFFCDFSQANIFTGRIYGKIGGCYPKKKGGGGVKGVGHPFRVFVLIPSGTITLSQLLTI